jgi:hypothetical protein
MHQVRRTACDAAAPDSSKTIPAYAHSFIFKVISPR